MFILQENGSIKEIDKDLKTNKKQLYSYISKLKYNISLEQQNVNMKEKVMKYLRENKSL